MAPVFHSVLGIDVTRADSVDTDLLGTFTGEVQRPGDMVETARRKARLGLETSGATLGIASEGAYGPHPVYHVVPSGTELMIFVDDRIGIEIVESIDVSATNFGVSTSVSRAIDEAFLDRIGFPDHGLIVEPHIYGGTSRPIAKGLTRRGALDRAIAEMSRLSEDGRARVHADMRAHMNPTRMREIRKVARKLANRLARACPACSTPGFGVTRKVPGLPCELCRGPTRLVEFDVHACAACNHEERHRPSDGKPYAESQACDFCNP